MRCPVCRAELRPRTYEGLRVDHCADCGGHWLDHGALPAIIALRETWFNPEERRAAAAAKPVRGVVVEKADNKGDCPRCAKTLQKINYGGDTGVLVDRCLVCRGVWLDEGELEHIQSLVESWDDMLPDDLRRFSPRLHEARAVTAAAAQATPSRVPLIGALINALVNGALDLWE